MSSSTSDSPTRHTLSQPILSHYPDIIPTPNPKKSNKAANSNEPVVHHARTTSRSFFTMEGISATWTIADQRRLTSIDALHTRLLEYHNNVHVRSVETVMQTQFAELSVRIGAHGTQNLVPFQQVPGPGFSRSYMTAVSPPGYSVSVNMNAANANIKGAAMGGNPLYSQAQYHSSIAGSAASALLASQGPVAYMMHIKTTTVSAATTSASGTGTPGRGTGTAAQSTTIAVDLGNPNGNVFNNNSSNSSNSNSSPTPTAVDRGHLMQALSTEPLSAIASKSLSSQSQAGTDQLLWIHMTDTSILDYLADRFNMHELCVSGLTDYRAHSSFVPVPGACLLSFCSFAMVGTDVSLVKVIVYFCKGLIITHERELHVSGISGEILPPDIITSKVYSKLRTLLPQIGRYGPLYLLYTLAHEALLMQEAIIDFFSRSLQYFKQMVNTRLHHRDKLKINRKMHIVCVSISMLQKAVELNVFAFNNLLRCAGATAEADPSSAAPSIGGPTSRLLSGLVTDEHLPYLLDLCDAYKFANHCLVSEFEEAVALDKAMDSITGLRNINTNTLLSLVATIFLPLNFLTGVFGTNFQSKGGGYYMQLLNNPNGPYFFGGICLLSIFVVVSYFRYNGWVEVRINVTRTLQWIASGCSTRRPKSSSSAMLMHRGGVASNSLDQEEEDEILAEEERRVRESLRRRASATQSTRGSEGSNAAGIDRGYGNGIGNGIGNGNGHGQAQGRGSFA